MSTRSLTFYHGTRAELAPQHMLLAQPEPLRLTPDLDEALWSATLSPGAGEPRVYEVQPQGQVQSLRDEPGYTGPPHPAMSWITRSPLLILRQLTEWAYYHGTRASLRPGDRVEPGHAANFGASERRAVYVYFSRTLDAAIWGAELARGDGPGRVYRVEPTGAFEDDPNLTDQRFPGNPTHSMRSRSPLLVLAELESWRGHPEPMIEAMRQHLHQLQARGVEPDDASPDEALDAR